MPKSFLLAPATILWKLLESYGHDPEPLFQRHGITPDMMKEPGARASRAVGDSLWISVAKLIDDPCFGLRAGEIWHPSHLGALGYAWLASGTLREALNRLERYVHVLSNIVDLKIEAVQGRLNISVSHAPMSFYIPARADQFFAIIMSMCRVNLNPELNPVAVQFIHDAPPCAGDYFAYFKAPVTFGAERNCLGLPIDQVDIPLKGYNPEILRMHDEIIVRHIAQLNKEDIVQRVKCAILDMLPSGQVSDEKVARKVNMSVRTLQRNLKNEGTTFGTLLDAVRRELAEDYVRDPNMSLTEIAFILGFSEQSAFARAFKRWAGVAPGKYRQGITS